MAKKIDPLNKRHYGPVSAMLTVSDVKAAAAFYQKAFGFAKRGVMNGPDGKPIHAELTLRGTTLMLGPENPARGMRSAKTVGASPASLYPLRGKCGQNSRKGRGSRSNHPRPGHGHVLGRSLRHGRRPRRIHMDGRHTPG